MFVRILATRWATKVDLVRPSTLVCVNCCWGVCVSAQMFLPKPRCRPHQSYQYIAYKVVLTCLPQCFINNSIDCCPQDVNGVADTCCMVWTHLCVVFTFVVCVCVCVYGDIQALIVCECVFQHTSTSCCHTKPDSVIVWPKN